MKIATCSLATLMLSGLAGFANADAFGPDRMAADGDSARNQSENLDARQLDQTRSYDWQHGPAAWVRDNSALPVAGVPATASTPATAAPEISTSSALSALVLLGGALILLRGRQGRAPQA